MTLSALDSGGAALSGAALSVTAGISGGLAAGGISGGGTNVVVLTGSQSQINVTLNSLVFDPSGGNLPNQTLVTLRVATSDLGNTGSGGTLTDTDSVSIMILKNNTNQPPVNTVPSAQTVNHNTGLVFSAINGNAIATSDPDAGVNAVQVTLNATNGTLTLNRTTNLTFTTGTGTNNATMTFTGALGNINAALSGMTFNPTANFTGSASVSITTNDQGNIGTGGAKSDTDSVTTSVTAVNAAPVNTVPAAQFTPEDTAKVFSSANGNAISVADVDAGSSAVKVTLTSTAGTLTLSGTTGLTITSGSNGSATMTFTGTIANINTALNGLSFTPTANASGSATVTIATDDQGNTGSGGALTDTDVVAITVTPVDDAPVNSVPGSATVAEDSSVTFSQANDNRITIADVDAGSSVVQVTLASTHGTLTLGGTTGLTLLAGTGTADATMTFTGTISAINAAINGLIFRPAADFNGSAVVTVTTDDLGNTGSGGPLTDVDTIAVTVSPVDDAPVAAVPGRQAAAGGSTLTFSSANGNAISVSDIDAGTSPVQVTLGVTSGTLTAVATSGVSIVGNGSGSVTLTGTVAKVNAAMDGLAYAPASNFGGTTTLTVGVDDQGNTGTGGPLTGSGTVAIGVTRLNQAPANSVPGAQQTAEDTAIVFSASGSNAITISDPDAGSANALAVTLTAVGGAMTLGGTSGLTLLDGDGSDDAAMTVLGTIADINAALDGLAFTPAADFNGTATITIITDDQGNTGAGGPPNDSDTIAVAVSAVNDAPTIGLPAPQATGEGTALAFSSAVGNAISIADVDAGTGELLVSLSAGHGTISLAGSSGLTFVTGASSGSSSLSFTGTLADINAALDGMQFVPTTAYTGTDSLAIAVDDQGNSGSGGALADSGSVAIAVDPINDPPSQSVPSTVQTFDEDTVLTFSTSGGNGIVISDTDAGNQEVEVTLAASDGVLSLASTAGLTFVRGTGTGDASLVIRGTIAAINTALDGLTLTPSPDFNGPSHLVLSTNDLGHSGAGGAKLAINYVLLQIDPVNDAPTLASPATATVASGSSLVLSSSDLIAIADVDADAGAVEVTLTATHGTLTLPGTTGLAFVTGTGTADATMTFTGTVAAINAALDGLSFQPANGFGGSASLGISVNDQGNTGAGGAKTATASVAITVTGDSANQAPVNSVPGSQTVAEDASLTFSSANANAITISDPDAGSSVVQVTLASTHGTLTLPGTTGLAFVTGTGTADATMTFTGTVAAINAALDGLAYSPAADYNGPASLTITTDDRGNTGTGGALTDADTIAITVSPANDPPVANPDTPSTVEDTPVTIDVLANDGDGVDTGETLVVTAVTQPAHGTATFTTSGVTYTPEADYYGTDTFTYTISDGNGGTDTASVTVTVTAVVDAPIANDDAATVAEDSTSTTISVLANDTDPDNLSAPFNAGLVVSAVTLPAHGSVTFTPSGVSYTSSADYFGTDSFTYTVSDGTSTDTATVTITVTEVDDAPIAQDDEDAIDEDATATGNVLSNDTDPDNSDGVTGNEDTLTVTAHTNPSHGSVTIAADGEYTYTPSANYFGTDSFTYTGSDGRGGSDTATVTITVAPVNDAPTISEIADVTMNEDDTSGPISFTVGDVETAAVSLTVTATSSNTTLIPAIGIVLSGPGASRTITLTPAANEFGTATITVTVSDGTTTTTTPFTVTAVEVNDAPVAGPDSVSTDEDTPLLILASDLLANDSDPDNQDSSGANDDVLAVTAVAATSTRGGTVTLASGTVTYRPPAGFTGFDTFTYTLSDGQTTTVGTVTVAVGEVNAPPVNGVPGPQAVDEDATLVFSSGNGNAITISDADAGGADVRVTLTATRGVVTLGSTAGLASSSGNGSASVTLTGTISAINAALDGTSYAPAADANGPATLTIVTNDLGNTGAGGEQSDTDVLNIAVVPVNDAPTAADGTETTAEDNAVSIDLRGLASDVETNPNALSYTIVVGPTSTQGTLAPTATPGIYLFTPAADFHGTASFTYSVTDGGDPTGTNIDSKTSNIATVTITITGVADAPIAQADAASVAEDAASTAIDVLANDSDPDNLSAPFNAGLVATGVTQPAHGSATFTASGVAYTPSANYFGTDTFTYTISDGTSTSTAIVTLTVAPVNDPPTATTSVATTAEDTPILIDVLAGTADVDGDHVTVVAVGHPAHGTTTINLDGTITYTPDRDYHGADSFTYTVSDGQGGDAIATIAVTVTPVNDPPVARDDSLSTPEGSALEFLASDLLDNDTDADSDVLSVIAVGTPAHGTATLVGGQVVYTPDPGFLGQDAFSVTISDGHGGQATSVAHIGVVATNHAPTASALSAVTPEAQAVTLDALASSHDDDGDSLSVVAATQGLGGSVVVHPDGTIAYTPAPGYSGVDHFTYTIADGRGGTIVVPVDVTVLATLASLSGRVYDDANDDGTLSPGERGISGVRMTLAGRDTDGRPVSREALTASDGSYTFAQLPAGLYSLMETQPGTFLDNTANPGTLGGTAGTNRVDGITVGLAARGDSYNFGELSPAGAGEAEADPAGYVYVDANNNGIFDPGERPIPGVLMIFTGIDDRGQDVRLTQRTRADGSYRFDMLRPGRYAIAEVQPSGFFDGRDTIGTTGGHQVEDGFTDIVLGPGEIGEGYNFGELEPGRISGLVYYDSNRNGRPDASDPGIRGVAVTLTGIDDLGRAVEATARTDRDGRYSFDGLRPGSYAVREAQPGAFRDSRDQVGSLGGSKGNDRVSSIVVTSGARGSGYSFGEAAKRGCSLPGMAERVRHLMRQIQGQRARDPLSFDAQHPAMAGPLSRGEVPWGAGPFPRGPLVHRLVPNLGTRRLPVRS